MKPYAILFSRPTFFKVADRKNPFMDPSVPVDRNLAVRQWDAVVQAFTASGLEALFIPALAACEDMVFTANPALTGMDNQGKRVAIASTMKFPSRRHEVAPQVEELRRIGYEIARANSAIAFEGGGDAVWNFERRLLFLGVGPRTSIAMQPLLEHIYGVDVLPLQLISERFYHLDTALCVLNNSTAIAYPNAFYDASWAIIEAHFERIIVVDEDEGSRMACNAAQAGGNTVIIEASAKSTVDHLDRMGYNVVPVDTSEFMKSGGSVYCMKQYIF